MNFEERCSQLEQELRLHQEREARYEERERVQQEQLEQQQVLISHLQQQIVTLMEQVASLEQQGKRDSHNSHLPPSSDRFVRQPKSLRKRSGKKAGGQEGHRGTTLPFSQTPDAVIIHEVERCDHCQQDLTAVPALRVERRQVIEVPPPRVLVQEHRAECKRCPHCQQHTTAPFPAGVRAPVQYGASIGARAVYLSQQQLLPFGRVCEVMEDLLGVALSEGSVRELIERCASKLGEVEPQIQAALRQA